MTMVRPATILLCQLLVLGASSADGASGTPDRPASPRSVAITIDDLPLAGGQRSGTDLGTTERVNAAVIAALEAHGAPAIGFVTESRLHVEGELDARRAILQAWHDSGLELGNHGFSHLSFQSTSLEEFEDDVLHGEVLTGQVLGRRPAWFRFPYNHTGPTAEAKAAMLAFLAERGYGVAPFTVEHSDYVFDALYASAMRSGDQATMERVSRAYLEHLDTAFSYAERFSVELFGREIPQVFLIHVNAINAATLDRMLERLEERGYAFISLGQAVQDEAYRTPDEYVGRWGISWLHRWNVSAGRPMRRDEPDPPRAVLDAYRRLTNE